MLEIISVLKAIPQLLQVIKMVLGIVYSWQQKQLDENYHKVERAIDELKNAKTKEEQQNATENLANSSL